MQQTVEIERGQDGLLKLLNQEIYEFCKDCLAWSGSDCTRNPYTDGCLKDSKNAIPKEN